MPASAPFARPPASYWRRRSPAPEAAAATSRLPGAPKINTIVIDSSLAASYHRGHPEHFAAGFADVCARNGHAASIVCHRTHFDAFTCSMPVIPVLTASLHDRLGDDSDDGRRHEFEVFARRFAEDLLASGLRVAPGDLVLMPTASAREVSGLGRWLKHLGVPVRVAAIFHWGDPRTLATESLEATLLECAGASVTDARPLEVSFRATTAELAQALSRPLGRPVQVTRSLTFLGARPADLPPNARKRIGILGGARREKGEDVVPELVRSTLAARRDIEFTVQDHRTAPGEPSPLAAEGTRVTLLRGWLHEDDMHRICATLDLAILPYERAFYADAVSGIFTLMTGFGVPCVVPSDTWMSARVESGEAAGIVYRGDGAQTVHAALIDAVDRIDRLRAMAAERAADWRSMHSAEGWIGDLLGAAT